MEVLCQLTKISNILIILIYYLVNYFLLLNHFMSLYLNIKIVIATKSALSNYTFSSTQLKVENFAMLYDQIKYEKKNININFSQLKIFIASQIAKKIDQTGDEIKKISHIFEITFDGVNGKKLVEKEIKFSDKVIKLANNFRNTEKKSSINKIVDELSDIIEYEIKDFTVLGKEIQNIGIQQLDEKLKKIIESKN